MEGGSNDAQMVQQRLSEKRKIFEKNVSPFSLLFHINSIFFQLTLRLQEVIPYEISKLSSKQVMTIF